MNFLKQIIRFLTGKPQAQRGIIVFEEAKVCITLPPDWSYFYLGDHTYIASADKKPGAIIISVHHQLMREAGDFVNPYTNKVEDITPEKYGRFDTYVIQGEGEREWAKIWDTETNTHFIRLMYTCPKLHNQTELESIMHILDSLEEIE